MLSNKKDFRLQSVLDFKFSKINLLEVEFAKLKAVHDHEVAEILSLERTLNREVDALQFIQQRGALDVKSIQLQRQYVRALDSQLALQMVRADGAKHRMESKRQELIGLMQDHQSLENLRGRHNAKQRQESNRREARTIDDIVTTRYGREN